ncbi:hypothetical protein BJV74DRAFT_796958 [Russula compacta]|nr:hypothetical protein BJV74DRAFT_796958 [Russula compacta]
MSEPRLEVDAGILNKGMTQWQCWLRMTSHHLHAYPCGTYPNSDLRNPHCSTLANALKQQQQQQQPPVQPGRREADDRCGRSYGCLLRGAQSLIHPSPPVDSGSISEDITVVCAVTWTPSWGCPYHLVATDGRDMTGMCEFGNYVRARLMTSGWRVQMNLCGQRVSWRFSIITSNNAI